jgi:hypothetical protein
MVEYKMQLRDSEKGITNMCTISFTIVNNHVSWTYEEIHCSFRLWQKIFRLIWQKFRQWCNMNNIPMYSFFIWQKEGCTSTEYKVYMSISHSWKHYCGSALNVSATFWERLFSKFVTLLLFLWDELLLWAKRKTKICENETFDKHGVA